MDVGNDTTASNGSLDQSVQLFVTADSQLQVTGSDALHLKILRGIASELEHLSGEVLQDRSGVNGRGGAHAAVRANSALQKSVNSSNRELCKSKRSARSRRVSNCWLDHSVCRVASLLVVNTYLKSGLSRPGLGGLLRLFVTELASFSSFSAFASL